MPLLLLVLLPAIAGVVGLRLRSASTARALLLTVAVAHLLATGALWFAEPRPRIGSLLGLDAAGLLFLTVTSVVFLAASMYSVPYLLHGTYESRTSPHRFVPCLLWFLAAMTLVTATQHLALLWAAVEATTLASAPLIYFYRRPGSLEAAWKYLLICSVGIALALLGVFFLSIAASAAPGRAPGLTVAALSAAAPTMSRPWLAAAFILALVGFGTKMGLVPLHTWLPDAHSQAPSPVSALLSGALLNCALLATLRFVQIYAASGDLVFARTLLLLFGFASIAVAAALMARQRDYKRLLAYSSIENMGIVTVGIGLGGTAAYGALFHAVNHSLCKASLFLVAGNVLREFKTTRAAAVRGALRRLPLSGSLFLTLLFAMGGAPPFGTFWSKLIVFRAAMDGTDAWMGILFAVLVAMAFLGMAGTILPMLQGRSTGPRAPGEAGLSVGPPLVLTACALLLGVSIPGGLARVLHEAALAVGARP
jgi:hydrogenase-4 component F